MEVTLTNPSGLNAKADVSFDAALDGQAPQPYRVDWGDGSPIASVASGQASVTHIYAKAGFYKIVVASNTSTSNRTLMVGNPTFPAPGAKFQRTQQVIREDAAAIANTKSKLG